MITVPIGSAVEWTAQLSGTLPIEQLAQAMDDPILRPLSARNTLSDTLGWDGGMMPPGQIYHRQFTRTGTYDYADGAGHTGRIIVIRLVKESQTITFGPLADKALSDPPFAITATASSGLPVTFTTSSNACAALGNIITLASGGTCAVTAHQSGDADYSPAPDVTQIFMVWRRIYLPIALR